MDQLFTKITPKTQYYRDLEITPDFAKSGNMFLKNSLKALLAEILHWDYLKIFQISAFYRIEKFLQGDQKTCQLVIFQRNNTAQFTKICI